MTPAARKPRKRSASTLVGLASSVTSTSGATVQCFATPSRIAATVAGCISDGVPPPKKMVVTSRPGVRCGHRRDLAQKALHEARLVDAAVADMAVEVAIGAFRQAERPVNVDAEASQGIVNVMLSIISRRHGRASAKTEIVKIVTICARGWLTRRVCQAGLRELQKARARCDRPCPRGGRPCFSSEVISPKVRSCPSGRNIGS